MSGILPNLSVDCVIFGFDDGILKVLLIKRDKEPEADQWSLPGGYVWIDEDVDDAAQRILQELTGIHNLFLSQVHVFGSTGRYPIQRVVSVLYCALIKPDMFPLVAGSHAKEVAWFPVTNPGDLPFDHNEMMQSSLNWLKKEIWHEPITSHLLPEKFPINQLQYLYETVLQEALDNRNFRKKVINQGLVERLNEKTKGGQQRPAYLYKLKK